MISRFFIFMLILFSSLVKGQVNDVIKIDNGSFEDSPRQGRSDIRVNILGWYDCGGLRFPDQTPPDIHPGGWWENNISPSHGKTYLGLVVRHDDTYEGVAQRLSSPLEQGKCYEINVNLTKSDTYLSNTTDNRETKSPFVQPSVLRVWGGSGFCSDRELLIESAAVEHNQWRTYTYTFKPKMTHNYILIEAYYKTPVLLPYNGHILVDKFDDIKIVSCPNSKDQAKISNQAAALPPHKRNRVEQSATKKSTTAQSPKADSQTLSNNSKPSVEQKVTKPQVPKVKILNDLDVKKLKPGSTIEVRNLYFEENSSTFSDASLAVLDEIAVFLNDHQNINLEVSGHTNTYCETDFCNKLSTERAKTVHDFLISKGVNGGRLTFIGHGKAKPKFSNATADGRRRNQRVELKVTSV